MLNHRIKHLLLSFAGIAGAYLALFSLPLAAQPAHDQAHHAAQPSSIAPQVNQEAAGDPYTLTTCPVSGQALGSMGEPVIYSYQGREIRFCCTGCVSQFEADPAEFIQKVDQSMIEDQLPVFPLDTCVVSGEKLGGAMGEPVDFIYNNRLVRFCCSSCIESFQKDPAGFLAKLDQAVIGKQKSTYTLTTCPVSGEKLGGAMGKPIDHVLANRLVRLCCPACKTELAKDPRKVLGKVDDSSVSKSKASKSKKSRPGHKPVGHAHS